MISRTITKKIKDRFFQGKAILITGPRQTGKTTISRHLVNSAQLPFLWLNADEADVRKNLTETTSTELAALIGKNQLLVIDEAQRITNIGITLKLLVDLFPDVQVIATGSSSFELSNIINEPLTGRKYEFTLYPISYEEMVDHTSIIEEQRLLQHRMIYGYYPEVVNRKGDEQEILHLLTDSYLYRDLMYLGTIKKPPLLTGILQALALQLGNEVSYTELAQLTATDPHTIEKYIDLLEKAYVIYKLPSLSRNIRNEIKKGKKIYFFDNGVRNAIIKNFNPLSLRDDTGALWENFLITERLKKNHYTGTLCNSFFWRTHAQQEIDYIEEYGGKLSAWEFKWGKGKKVHFPKNFLRAYPNSDTQPITQENYRSFILP